jgi:hypothetical protein
VFGGKRLLGIHPSLSPFSRRVSFALSTALSATETLATLSHSARYEYGADLCLASALMHRSNVCTYFISLCSLSG